VGTKPLIGKNQRRNSLHIREPKRRNRGDAVRQRNSGINEGAAGMDESYDNTRRNYFESGGRREKLFVRVRGIRRNDVK